MSLRSQCKIMDSSLTCTLEVQYEIPLFIAVKVSFSVVLEETIRIGSLGVFKWCLVGFKQCLSFTHIGCTFSDEHTRSLVPSVSTGAQIT